VTGAAVAHTEPSPGAKAPPFHGWRIVAAGVVAQMLGVGLLSAYGVFVVPLLSEFDTSMAALGFGFSIFMLVGGAIGPVLGPALDRGPIRAIMLTGVVLMTAALLLMARAQHLWQLGLLLALAGLGVLMYGPLPVHVLLVHWFAAYRGRALALAALGVGVPGFFVPPLAAWLIEFIGWRGTLSALALGSAAVVAPVVAWLIVKRPEDVGQLPDGLPAVEPEPGEADTRGPSTRALLRQRNFWTIALFFNDTATTEIYTALYLVAFLESLGVPRTRGAFVLSLMAVFSIIGKLVVATIADRTDKRQLIWGLLAIQIASWMLLLARPHFALVFVAAAGLGLGTGGLVPLPPLVLGACFGREVFGRVAGLMGPVRLPLSLAIPPLGGWLIDWSGGYAATFALGAGLLAVSGLILGGVRIPRRVA
jgi:MFS family permease